MKTVLLLLAIAIQVGCERNQISGPTSALNTEFTLGPGGIMTVESIAVRFLRVTKDSRCPINALCVTAGDATAEVALTTVNVGRSYDVNLVQGNRVTHDGFTVTFVRLDPANVAGQTIELVDYRATFRVGR